MHRLGERAPWLGRTIAGKSKALSLLPQPRRALHPRSVGGGETKGTGAGRGGGVGEGRKCGQGGGGKFRAGGARTWRRPGSLFRGQVKQMSRQVSRGSTGEYQADEQAGVARLARHS